jgi:hypothetical protein
MGIFMVEHNIDWDDEEPDKREIFGMLFPSLPPPCCCGSVEHGSLRTGQSAIMCPDNLAITPDMVDWLKRAYATRDPAVTHVSISTAVRKDPTDD